MKKRLPAVFMGRKPRYWYSWRFEGWFIEYPSACRAPFKQVYWV
jgi:hypothetical protein